MTPDAPAVTLSAYGLRVGIEAEPEDARAALAGLRHLRPSRGRRGEDRRYVLPPSADGREVEMAIRLLESDLERFLAENARGYVFVHAGAVAWNGKALVLPGRSGWGKSTLVAALVEAGATYYSDEYAVLDSRGRVHPFARRLALRQAGGGVRRVWAEELGGRSAARSCPLGAVVMTRFREGAPWRPRRLSPGQATLALLRHTVAARARSAESLRVLGGAARLAPTLSVGRSEAAAAVPALLALLS